MHTGTRSGPAAGADEPLIPSPASASTTSAASVMRVGSPAQTSLTTQTPQLGQTGPAAPTIPPARNGTDDLSFADDAARAWLRAQTLPPLPVMMLRGAGARCPLCGVGHLFEGYLRLVHRCLACDAPLAAVRADDAPPYFTIFITAHIIIALVVLTTHDSILPIWSMIAGFVPLTLVVALLLLRPIKGATVGVMLKLGLIGEHRQDTA